jgi:hypothetical protein
MAFVTEYSAFDAINKNMDELISYHNGTSRSPVSVNLMTALVHLRFFAMNLSETELTNSIYKCCKLPFLPQNSHDHIDSMNPLVDTNMNKNIRMVEFIRMLCRIDRLERVLFFTL